MAWKSILLDKLLYKPILSKDITAITSPYYQKQVTVGVGEEINLLFNDGDETKILECKVKSMNIVKYKHLTRGMAVEAGFKTGDILRYHLQETFKEHTNNDDYFLHMVFDDVKYVHKSEIEATELKENLIKMEI